MSVKLQSKEEEVFEVKKEAIKVSETVQNILDDIKDLDVTVPLPTTSSKIVEKVI